MWSLICYLSSRVLNSDSPNLELSYSDSMEYSGKGTKTCILGPVLSPTSLATLGKSFTSSRLQSPHLEKEKDSSRWSLRPPFSLTFYEPVNYYENFLGQNLQKIGSRRFSRSQDYTISQWHSYNQNLILWTPCLFIYFVPPLVYIIKLAITAICP